MAQRSRLTFNADGVTPPADVAGQPYNAVYLVGDGGAISAGVITVQTCDWLAATPPPEAAWKSLAVTINAADATLGAQGFAQIPAGAYTLVRCKVTTPLSGAGTVQAVVVSSR